MTLEKFVTYVFRGGYVEDASGDRWWREDLLTKAEQDRDEARHARDTLFAHAIALRAALRDYYNECMCRGAHMEPLTLNARRTLHEAEGLNDALARFDAPPTVSPAQDVARTLHETRRELEAMRKQRDEARHERDAALVAVEKIKVERESLQQQLQGQGTGLTALALLLGSPENGLIDAVRQVIAERDKAKANYQFMVDRAINEKLDGYRELASKCAVLENERDAGLVEIDKLRNALAAISLTEYESTSSASEKVHDHVRFARRALYGNKK